MNNFDDLVTAAALGLIVLVLVLGVFLFIYRAAIFLGDPISEWWPWGDRKSRKTTQQPQIVWANDGSTGRIITDKPITPNQLRALQGLSPFHKHNYKLIRARHHIYEFVCRKDGCSENLQIPREIFWDGESEKVRLYVEYFEALRDYERGIPW